MHVALMVAGWFVASLGVALGAFVPGPVAAGVVLAGIGVFLAGWDLSEPPPPEVPSPETST